MPIDRHGVRGDSDFPSELEWVDAVTMATRIKFRMKLELRKKNGFKVGRSGQSRGWILKYGVPWGMVVPASPVR